MILIKREVTVWLVTILVVMGFKGLTKTVTNNVAAEAEFTSYLSTLSGTITTTWKRETNKLIKSFKTAALWENGALWGRSDHINNFIGHISQANALKNMLADSNYATQTGTNSFGNKGIRVNYPVNTGIVKLTYNPSSGATHFINTDSTLSIFLLRKDYTGKYHVGSFDDTKFTGMAFCPSSYPGGNAAGAIACTVKDFGVPSSEKRGLVCLRRTGTTISMRVNKTSVYSGTVTNQGFANLPLWLGGFNYKNSTLNQQGDNRYGFVLCSNYLTDNECDTLDTLINNYVSAAYTQGSFSRNVCVCDGNSLTLGSYASDAAHSYPSLMNLTAENPSWEVANLGISGQPTVTMTANAPLNVDNDFYEAQNKSVLVAWEIINDLYIGCTSKEDAYANFVTYCQARRAAGWSVVACTCIDYDGAFIRDARTKIAWINTQIRNNYATFADRLADLAADVRLQNADDMTYFNADKIHLTDAGYAVVASIIKPIVLSF